MSFSIEYGPDLSVKHCIMYFVRLGNGVSLLSLLSCVFVVVVVVVIYVVIVNDVRYFAFLSNVVVDRYSLSMGFNRIMHRTNLYMNMADHDDDDVVAVVVVYLLNSYS